MTIFVIYLSGVVFFLIQAVKYGRVSGARVRGAICWPLLILVAPQVWTNYRRKIEQVENGLAYNELIGIAAMTLGHDKGRFMWGIGA